MSSAAKNLSDHTFSSLPQAKNMRFGIAVSQWNPAITAALYKGAVETLLKAGAKKKNIRTIQVPGSFELSHGAQVLASSKKKPDAVICLGCVIQGETRHFEFICNAVANGITQVSILYNLPVVFGVLTTDSLQQAKDRSGGKHGNKGVEAAVTALQMAALRS